MKQLLLPAVTAMLIAAPALAQSPASNKAFFTGSSYGVTFAPVSGAGYSDPVTIYYVEEAVKTSNNGGISATLSLESALWTYNVTEAIVGKGRASSSSRAGIKVWLEVDGQMMEPGYVVYADRLQATGATLDLTCVVPNTTCEVTGDLTLELYQATKSANAFTFYLGPLSPTIHSVAAYAQAVIECRKDGVVIECPTDTIDGYTDASTQAAIGASSLMIEEQQLLGQAY